MTINKSSEISKRLISELKKMLPVEKENARGEKQEGTFRLAKGACAFILTNELLSRQ